MQTVVSIGYVVMALGLPPLNINAKGKNPRTPPLHNDLIASGIYMQCNFLTYSSFTIFAECTFFGKYLHNEMSQPHGGFTTGHGIKIGTFNISMLSSFKTICKKSFRKISEPTVGPLHDYINCPCGCKNNWAILVNLWKLICAQVHFHKTIDIKPRMDSTNGQHST